MVNFDDIFIIQDPRNMHSKYEHSDLNRSKVKGNVNMINRQIYKGTFTDRYTNVDTNRWTDLK